MATEWGRGHAPRPLSFARPADAIKNFGHNLFGCVCKVLMIIKSWRKFQLFKFIDKYIERGRSFFLSILKVTVWLRPPTKIKFSMLEKKGFTIEFQSFAKYCISSKCVLRVSIFLTLMPHEIPSHMCSVCHPIVNPQKVTNS